MHLALRPNACRAVFRTRYFFRGHGSVSSYLKLKRSSDPTSLKRFLKLFEKLKEVRYVGLRLNIIDFHSMFMFFS